MIFYSPYIGAEMLRSYMWMDGWVWVGWDLCVGLLYEHRFAVLITTITILLLLLHRYYVCPYIPAIGPRTQTGTFFEPYSIILKGCQILLYKIPYIISQRMVLDSVISMEINIKSNEI